MREFGGLVCCWSNLNEHPACPHGPTLLFEKNTNGELKQFYVCSACRDRKLCTFYAEKDAKFTEAQKKAWKEKSKKMTALYNHRKLFVRFNESMIESPGRRAYCHTCEKLVLPTESSLHTDHEIRTGITDDEMTNPTFILKPLANDKKEAQYLFSEKATTEITNLLVKAGAKQVLCIGSPRIHEHITKNFEHKMSSLLLDFDGRFHNFFGPLSYCWYNLFNNYFFTKEGAQTFRDFMTQNNGKDTFVICDPPFGGRVEPISQTIKTITEQHKQWNNIRTDDTKLNIIFVFPYFMESIIREKSNPPGVEGGLKDLKMSDYKVEYDNHPLFVTGSNGRKYGSPVRIFTNIDLNLLELPAEDGYKYCGKCLKWVSPENKHCKKCKSCTSKDGRRYKHCELCQRCVKPTWEHCLVCDRCTQKRHTCGEKPKITGQCFVCGGKNHTGKNCDNLERPINPTSSAKMSNKRKNALNANEMVIKKRKSVGSEARTIVSETTSLKARTVESVRVEKRATNRAAKTQIISARKSKENLIRKGQPGRSKVVKTVENSETDSRLEFVEKKTKKRKIKQKER